MAPLASRSRPTNLLLASLPRAEFARMSPSLEPVNLTIGQSLHEPGNAHEHFYFPMTSIVSLVGVLRNGATTELSLVGREGAVGLALVLGGDATLTRTIVQSAGTALRWKSGALKRELKRGGAVQHLLLRYVQAIWAQTAQSALCNRHHTLQQQLCKWLLLSFDRVDDRVLRMTQQLIADMIGVRREGVALAASRLRYGRHPQPSRAGGQRLRVLPNHQPRIPPATWMAQSRPQTFAGATSRNLAVGFVGHP